MSAKDLKAQWKPETAENGSPAKAAKTTAHKAKKSGSNEQVGWASGLVGLVVLGLLVWGIWSWVAGGEDPSELASITDNEEVDERVLTPDPIKQTTGTEESTATQSAELLGTYYVNANSLNQRGTPGGDVVSKVTRGQALEVTEVRDGWARVRKDGGASRWVSFEYLSREKPATLPQNRTLAPAPVIPALTPAQTAQAKKIERKAEGLDKSPEAVRATSKPSISSTAETDWDFRSAE